MSGLRAVTFDFWSTLVDGSFTPERTADRMARLHAAVVGAGHACSVEEVSEAFDGALADVSATAAEAYADVGPPGRWAAVARLLAIPEGLVPFEVVERAYDDITLEPLPPKMPYIDAALQLVKRAGYRMAVICNTGMAGGRVLREVLRRHGLFEFFDVTVFSNEFGYAKPNPSIFLHTLQALGGDIAPQEALHVGDLEELDVDGARAAGLFSALYAPEPGRTVATDADLVVRDWREFADQLKRVPARER